LTIRRLVTIIAFLAIFAMAARVSMDTDTWWHLRAGQWILEHRAVPQQDPFSYTRLGEAWSYPGWLVEVPMYWIYQAAGPGGLNLWTAVMVTLTFVFVWKTLSGGPFLRAFVIVLAAAASAVYWAARPYLVTFLLAAVFLWVLEDFRWRRSPAASRRLAWLPILMVVWANSHGGFAVGFLIWGVYLAGEAWAWLMRMLAAKHPPVSDVLPSSGSQTLGSHTLMRKVGQALSKNGFFLMLLVGAAMILAVCLNPSGPLMLFYAFKTVSIGALQNYIQEWQSPDFHRLASQPFIWLLVLTIAALGASRRRLALTDFLLVAGFAYLGLLAWRNVALFALAAPPVISRHLAPLLEALGRQVGFREVSDAKPSRPQAILNWVLLVVLVLAVLLKAAASLPAAANQTAFRTMFPLDAVAYLKAQHPPGRLFNSYNWGSYLLWELPEYPVFIDGRTDLYNDEVINQWLQVVRAGPGWQQVLDRWEVRLVLLEPGVPVTSLLEQAGWKRVYSDSQAVIYER